MTPHRLTNELPPALSEALERASQEQMVELGERGLHDPRIEPTLERYAAGSISFAATARMAGLSYDALARQAYARGLQPPPATRPSRKNWRDPRCRCVQRRASHCPEQAPSARSAAALYGAVLLPQVVYDDVVSAAP